MRIHLLNVNIFFRMNNREAGCVYVSYSVLFGSPSYKRPSSLYRFLCGTRRSNTSATVSETFTLECDQCTSDRLESDAEGLHECVEGVRLSRAILNCLFTNVIVESSDAQ